jgi:hypothetical protein
MLLRDGAGPLYHAESDLDLGAAVRCAIRYLNPMPGAYDLGIGAGVSG